VESRMLTKYGGSLTGVDSARIWRLIFQATPYDRDIAMVYDPRPELLPLVLGDTTNVREARWALGAVAASRVSLDKVTILHDALVVFTYLCDSAEGARRGACEAIGNLGRNALQQAQSGQKPADEVLGALATRAEDAARQGAITRTEAALIAGNARVAAGLSP
ncbi:MAG: hypothetical protein ACREL4_09740, partial [Gemmatimonadales bacterium]